MHNFLRFTSFYLGRYPTYSEKFMSEETTLYNLRFQHILFFVYLFIRIPISSIFSS
jgi:hypothetical protein